MQQVLRHTLCSCITHLREVPGDADSLGIVL